MAPSSFGALSGDLLVGNFKSGFIDVFNPTTGKFQGNLNDPAGYTQFLTAWWQGAGLVGRCPGCGHYVLFSMTDKQAIPDPVAAGLTVLPDDWHQNAYVL